MKPFDEVDEDGGGEPRNVKEGEARNAEAITEELELEDFKRKTHCRIGSIFSMFLL